MDVLAAAVCILFRAQCMDISVHPIIFDNHAPLVLFILKKTLDLLI